MRKIVANFEILDWILKEFVVLEVGTMATSLEGPSKKFE